LLSIFSSIHLISLAFHHAIFVLSHSLFFILKILVFLISSFSSLSCSIFFVYLFFYPLILSFVLPQQHLILVLSCISLFFTFDLSNTVISVVFIFWIFILMLSSSTFLLTSSSIFIASSFSFEGLAFF
jgi:hypothetical protein